MSVQTPKQQVDERFGTRSDLVSAILPLIGGDDQTRSKLMGTTNKKLLRLHEVAQDVQRRFGGKGGLIDAMAKLQFDGRAPNPGWREAMERKSIKRLWDMHRQLGG